MSNDPKTLRDYLELAAERRATNSGRRLAEIAQDAGHEISHSTVNRIRKGDYPSAPTAGILRAIAFLALEPEEDVFAAAPDTSNWAELESLVAEFLVAHERTRIIVGRYARLRGLVPEAAEAELLSIAPQRNDFFHNHRNWTPPWDPAAGSGGFMKQAAEHVAELHRLPSAARDAGTVSEGRRLREEQDRAAEAGQQSDDAEPTFLPPVGSGLDGAATQDDGAQEGDVGP